jgi:DNA ligase (NAD+)
MQVSIQPKIDGIAVCATYHDHHLIALTTRGDGQVGDDITAHAPHIKNLPLTITDGGRVNVRGEAVIYQSDFQQHYAHLKKADGSPRYKNARNTCGGLIKGRSESKDLNNVHFIAYEYHGPKRDTIRYESGMIGHLFNLGFEVPQTWTVDSAEQATDIYNQYDKQGLREQLPYKTDGLVMKVDDIQQHGRLPGSSGRPGHATAVKPTTKNAITRIRTDNPIIWSMGLSGRFTPVAQVEPVQIDGEVTVRQINMFNLRYLEAWVYGGTIESVKGTKTVQGGFGPGAEVLIERTGDVLPYLVDVIVPSPELTPAE